MFSKIEIAKYAANLAVQFTAAKAARNMLVNNTNLAEDALSVQVGSAVIGWQVGEHSKPYTNRMVEKAAAWLETKKNEIPTK